MTINISQTPQELLDYEIDWVTRGLADDTIATSAWVASSDDCTLSNSSIGPSPSTGAESSATTIWLTGGVAQNIYTITNTITTAAGRTMQETITYLCVAQRVINNY